LAEVDPERRCLCSPIAGYELQHDGERVNTVFIYVRPKDGFLAYADTLPAGIDRNSARMMIRSLYGTPERSGEAMTLAVLGRRGPWDRFKVNSNFVHFEFAEPDGGIAMITLMTPKAAP
jgi:hypothetical protein